MSSFSGETKTSPTTPSLEWVRLADQSNAFSLTNSCLPWNYPHPNDNQHIVTVTSITSPMILLQPKLIPKEYKKIHGITRRTFTGGTKNLWLQIYSYLQPFYCTRIELKCLCRLFNDVEKMITFNPNCSPLKPIPRGSYTSFPHPKYASLPELTNRLNELPRDGSITLPAILFIENGVYDEQGERVLIHIPISIFGESKEGVQIIGGLWIEGKTQEDVYLNDCTVTGAKGHGVLGNKGAAMHLKNVCVEKCGECGVFVNSTIRNTMMDCNVNNNVYCGLLVVNYGACITIDGATTIHHNVTGGDSSAYGLKADSSCFVHLKSSLATGSTLENNGGGGNWGGDGTIAIVDNEGTIVETIQEANDEHYYYLRDLLRKTNQTSKS